MPRVQAHAPVHRTIACINGAVAQWRKALQLIVNITGLYWQCAVPTSVHLHVLGQLADEALHHKS